MTRSGQPLDLTLREFELLEFLMRYEGQIVSRDTLAREVWKESGRTPSLDNVMDAHMARLRRKFDGNGHSGQDDPYHPRSRVRAPGRRSIVIVMPLFMGKLRTGTACRIRLLPTASPLQA